MRRSYMLRFCGAGSYFQVHVALSRRPGERVRAEVLRILDSFTATRG